MDPKAIAINSLDARMLWFDEYGCPQQISGSQINVSGNTALATSARTNTSSHAKFRRRAFGHEGHLSAQRRESHVINFALDFWLR
jgi:hypothetical protein